MAETVTATASASIAAMRRAQAPRLSIDEAYSPSANYLEVEVCNPQTHSLGGKRFTDFEVRLRTNLPVLGRRDVTTRRRYSDFVWLRDEIRRSVKIRVPPLPTAALLKQLPVVADGDALFDDDFLEERRRGLEEFLSTVAGHPLVQIERSLHFFLREGGLDRAGYAPGRVAY